MTYLFVLGNSPELAKAEISAVLERKSLAFTPDGYSRNLFLVNSPEEISPEIFSILGGTVKVGQVFSGPVVAELIKGKRAGERLNFGLSGEVDSRLNKEIKRQLEEAGFKARFVLPASGTQELSSVVVAKQHLCEIYIFSIGAKKYTARTIWVQDFAQWSKRDYDRPAVQAHLGMLPPKVARMMVNIGLAGVGNSQQATILDPFCGVGTILAEALFLGCRAIGADINPQQIARTKKNLEWLSANYKLVASKYEILNVAAEKISQHMAKQSLDAIVTEPDLGPTDMDRRHYDLAAINARLLELYRQCLTDWKDLIRPSGKIVIVLPSYQENTELLHNLIDKAKVMGYSLRAGPFPYFRPQALVRRNICVFTRN